MKVLVVIGIILFLLFLAGVGLFITTSQVTKADTGIYQGPVRPMDDEPYFRQTGITKPLINP